MDLPYGDPQLMWSFNRDGECDEDMRTERDTTMGLDTDAMRAEHRSAYLDLAEPRCDVSRTAKETGAAPTRSGPASTGPLLMSSDRGVRGAPGGSRTPDQEIRRLLLYPLSY